MAAGEKKSQVLELDPPIELVFKGPFEEVVTSSLHLKNPTNEKIVFKVKTTAPKQYCVRPNSGVLEPHGISTIAVMLQPIDHSTSDRSKHKFMVQAMFPPAEFDPDQLDALMKHAPKSQMMDSKLRCVFVEADPNANQMDSTPDNEQAPAADVAASFTSFGDAEQVRSLPAEETTRMVDGQESVVAQQPTAGSTPAHTAVGPRPEVQKAQQESNLRLLQDKVDKLSVENNQLRSESNRLRQRITQVPPLAKATSHAAAQPQSSSLNIFAILFILVALVLGYLVGRWL